VLRTAGEGAALVFAQQRVKTEVAALGLHVLQERVVDENEIRPALLYSAANHSNCSSPSQPSPGSKLEELRSRVMPRKLFRWMNFVPL
jgi:hypothetical protein